MGCAWSADGRMLAATSSNYRGYVWNAENGQRVADLVGHQSEVFRCDFGPDAAWLATASWDGTTRFWDPVTGTHLLTAQGNVTSLGPDGRWLSVTRSDRTSILSLEGFAESKTLHAHWGSKGPWHVSFDRQGRVLTSSSPDGLRIWNASSGRPMGELSVPGGALTALFHPAGKELITSGYLHCSRWPIEFNDNTHTNARRPAGIVAFRITRERQIRAPRALSADGSRLAVTDQMRGRIDVLSVADPSSRRDIGPMANLAGTLMSPDGRWLVGTTWPSPEARIWDVASGRRVRNLSAEKPLTSLAFSPDGKFLCIGSEREPNMMEVGTWQRVRAIPADETGVAAWLPTFSPDGRMLAVARRGNREIQLLDTETLHELARLVPADPQPFTYLTFSPDGRRLAASCATHVVQLWDIGLIRKELRKLNLDWSHPAPAMSDDDTEWRLEVHGNSTEKK